jgi:hypothetical protein
VDPKRGKNKMKKNEMLRWFECIALDKRIPQDVRDMCKDICERNGFPVLKNWSAQLLGAKGGAVKSEAKSKAARKNGKKGGRPKKKVGTNAKFK